MLQPATIDYRATRRGRASAMSSARIVVAVVGIALPYVARLPGVFVRGPEWLTSYAGSGPGAVLFFALTAINWGAVVLGTLAYRAIPAVVVAALVGFAWPAYQHATLDLASDAQAAAGLVAIPVNSLPLVGLGWVLGFWVDDWVHRRSFQSQAGSGA